MAVFIVMFIDKCAYLDNALPCKGVFVAISVFRGCVEVLFITNHHPKMRHRNTVYHRVEALVYITSSG